MNKIKEQEKLKLILKIVKEVNLHKELKDIKLKKHQQKKNSKL